MASEWRQLLLEDMTDNFDAVRIPVKRADRSLGPYPYYGASGVVDHVDAYLFDGEYLLVAEDGENLRTRKTPIAFLATGKFWVNNHAHILRGNDQANTRFLKYVLAELDISGYLTGSTMPKLTQGNLNRVMLPAPPMPEQRAIAHILGTLDENIELNQRMNQTLEAMAQVLFKEWFVDFGPVRAKMNDRDPGIPRPIADLFSESLINSAFGEVPVNWRAYTLADLACRHTQSIVPSKRLDSLFELFSIPAYDAGKTPTLEPGAAIKSSKTIVPQGSVLLSKLNPDIPRVWMPNQSSGTTQICSTEFLAFTPSAPANSSLLFSLFSDGAFRTKLQSMVTGTSKSHQRVPPKALNSLQVLYGTPALFRLFGEIAAPWLRRAVANRANSQLLAAMRDALLPKLITGKIRVRDAEKLVESVA